MKIETKKLYEIINDQREIAQDRLDRSIKYTDKIEDNLIKSNALQWNAYLIGTINTLRTIESLVSNS